MVSFALQEWNMSEKNRRLFAGLAVLAVVSAWLAMPLRGQALDRRVQELEKQVAQLEQRILKLEALIAELQKAPNKPALSAVAGWKDKANWRRLKKGMTKSEVERILGVALKVVPNSHYGDIWYYPDLQGGNASFDTEGTLTSWDEI